MDTYASAPVAALALAVGLLAAEAEAILAAFFAIWSAAIVVVNLRGRIDPAGGFAAALGAPQREDLERLQSAGLLLLPEDDPGPWKLHVMQGLGDRFRRSGDAGRGCGGLSPVWRTLSGGPGQADVT